MASNVNLFILIWTMHKYLIYLNKWKQIISRNR